MYVPNLVTAMDFEEEAVKATFSSFLPDPRGAGLEQAFQFSYVRTYVRPSVRTYVSEIKFWSLHIH